MGSLAQYDFDKFSPNTFALVFPNIPGVADNSMLILNVHSVNLPNLELGAKDIRWLGGTTHIPEAVTHWGALTVQFVVDERMKNWRTIFKWITSMHNNKDKYVPENRASYAIDASLIMLDNYKKPFLEFKFVNAFPTTLSECSMSYREGNRYIESSVSLTYDYYDVEEIN